MDAYWSTSHFNTPIKSVTHSFISLPSYRISMPVQVDATNIFHFLSFLILFLGKW